MRAIRMTFFHVEKDGVETEPVLRPGVEDVSDFLVAHVESLQERASGGSTANASFSKAGGDGLESSDLLEAIRCGDDDAFLAASGALDRRLLAAMKHVGNAALGLLLCATVVDEASSSSTRAVVLKLEVVSEQGAVLRDLDGVETLAAVKDVLDQPGKLQKGVVFPDSRPGSQAVVGDLSGDEAQYFLRAVGIVLEMHAKDTAKALVSAVARQAGSTVAQKSASILRSITAGTTAEVVRALRERVPELDGRAAAAVVAILETGKRPVVRVDTAASVRAKIKIGSLTLSGPAEEIARVSWDEDASGRWTTTVPSETEPSLS